jgi:hypothetical protein
MLERAEVTVARRWYTVKAVISFGGLMLVTHLPSSVPFKQTKIPSSSLVVVFFGLWYVLRIFYLLVMSQVS